MDTIPHYRCCKCRIEKPVTEFHKGRNPGGIASYCKGCKSSIPDLRKGRGVREDLAGQRKTTWTVVRWAARGKWLVRCDCGREKVIFASNWRHGKGTQTCACTPRVHYNQLPPGEAGCNELLTHYKQGATRRGMAFELTPEQFKMLTSMDCAYCGASPSQKNYTRAHYQGTPYVYNGIDRIDSALGYTWNNCTPCCFPCNRSKSSMPMADWMEHIKRIYNYMRLGST